MTPQNYIPLHSAAKYLGIPEIILYAMCNTSLLDSEIVWIHPQNEYLINVNWIEKKKKQLPAPAVENEKNFIDWLRR